jgi:hypothetical protein
MSRQVQEREEIRLYLLGLLPEERQRTLEERLLTDDELYEELYILEDELIDEYLSSGLTGREQGAFATSFMNSPERLQQVQFATALKRFIAGEGAATEWDAAEPLGASGEGAVGDRRGGIFPSWLRSSNTARAFSLAAAAVLLVSGITWLAMRSLRPRAPRQVITVVLTPRASTRSDGDVQQFSIVPQTDAVRLQLRLGADDFRHYSATLLNADGATVLIGESLTPEMSDIGRVVVVNMPARTIPPGEYQLRLSGVYDDGRSEVAESYRFKVIGR